MNQKAKRLPKSLFPGQARIWIIVLLVFWSVYALGSSLFLSTSLFGNTTGMTDPELTQINFHGAISPFPGYLWAKGITLSIRDPNVNAQIELRSVSIRFSPFALFEKQARVHSLRSEKSKIEFKLKTPEQRKAFLDSHPPRKKPETLEAAEAIARERKERGWTIDLRKVALTGIEHIRFEKNSLQGEIEIQGAFRLIPGAEAEVGHSTLRIREGAWNDEIEKAELVLEARFKPWSIPGTSGSEVFKNLDAKLEMSAVANHLKMIDLMLRSLGEYGFGANASRVHANLSIADGQILGGSHFTAEESALSFKSPRFDLKGKGKVEWSVPPEASHSILSVDVKDAEARIHLSKKMRIQGEVPQVRGIATLEGLLLPSVFSGLRGSLSVQKAKVEARTLSDEPWKIKASIHGDIDVIAGNVPRKNRPKKQSSRLTIGIHESEVKLRQFGKIRGQGKVEFALLPVDFQNGKARFSNARLVYSGRIDGEYPFQLRIRSEDLHRLFDGEEERWAGKAILSVDGFDEILHFLSDREHLSGFVRSVLTSKRLETKLNWRLASKSMRIDADSIKTGAAWSAAGSFNSREGEKSLGVFEARVAGLPIGVGLIDGDLRLKALPNEAWYERLRAGR